MSDWGPVFIAVVLFILLTPGLLIQIPGKSRFIEFGNFQTSGLSILIHSVIYFALIWNSKQLEFGSMKTNGKAIAIHTLLFFAIYAVLILAVHLHIYTG
ncbi:hypothetical protein CCACVL1_10212 [Corchorus capsularis]|uniref:Uncharacterized protein n=1 Tax=Corchorus capsularis TaxID=210143 RepID=A0A1R3IS52_COCAP|nr:hypothetical protein CCACVL1_10212 [Corchorus capsularis]